MGDIDSTVRRLYEEGRELLESLARKGLLLTSVTVASFAVAYALTPRSVVAQTQTVIYVDDSNTSGVEDGTQSHPFNTISEVFTLPQYLAKRYTVVVAEGNYPNQDMVPSTGSTVQGAGYQKTKVTNSQIVLMGGTIRGFYLEDSKIAIGAGTAVIEQNYLKSTPITAILGSGGRIANNILTYAETAVIVDNSGIDIFNNTFYGNSRIGIRFSKSIRRFYNNILANNGTGIERMDSGTPSIDYNLFFGNSIDVNGASLGTGNVFADPKLVNAAGGDFRLQQGSPAINAGDPNVKDKDGSRSDMGAYGGSAAIGDGGTSSPPPSEPPPSQPPPTTTDTTPPYLKWFRPSNGEQNVPIKTDIEFLLADDGAGIDTSSLVMTLNQIGVKPSISLRQNGDVHVIYRPSNGIEAVPDNPYWRYFSPGLMYNQVVQVGIKIQDRAPSPNVLGKDQKFYIEHFNFSGYHLVIDLENISNSGGWNSDFGRSVEPLEFSARLYGQDNLTVPIQEFRATADGHIGFRFDNVEQISRFDVASGRRVSTLTPGVIEIVKDNGYIRRDDPNTSTSTPRSGKRGNVVTRLTAHYSLEDFSKGTRIIFKGGIFEEKFRIDNEGNYDHRSFLLKYPNRNNDHQFIDSDDLHSGKRSMLLIPGLNNRDGYWGYLPDVLRGKGYNVFEFYYYPNDGKIGVSSIMVNRALYTLFRNVDHQKFPHLSEFDVVGHSMGGLIARALQEGLNDRAEMSNLNFLSYQDAVKSILMLGTPNHGSQAAARIAHGDNEILKGLASLIGGLNPEGEAYKDLSPGSPKITLLNALISNSDINRLNIAGTRDIPGLTAVHREETGYQDGVVSVSSASLLDYDIPLGLVPFNHLELSGKGLERDSEKLKTLVAIIEGFYNGMQPATMKSRGLLDEVILPTRDFTVPFPDERMNFGSFRLTVYDKNNPPKIIPSSTLYLHHPQSNLSAAPALEMDPGSFVYYPYSMGAAYGIFGSGLSLPAGQRFSILTSSNPLEARTIGSVIISPLQTVNVELKEVKPSWPAAESRDGLVYLWADPSAYQPWISFLKVQDRSPAEGRYSNAYLIGPDNATLEKKMQLMMDYSLSAVGKGAFSENDISIYQFSEASGKWEKVPGLQQRYPEVGRILAEISQLGLFVISSGPGPVTSIEELSNQMPAKYELLSNYPNPFNFITTIRYTVGQQGGRVEIEVFNLLGQEVRNLVDEEKQPGAYEARWDGHNDAGQRVSSGVYLYRMHTGNRFMQTRKMLLLK
ncbi:T9SS type A sorting domain-containing protein [Candidatus Woesearchaeota archaeon]|nr:T9SS type A sorting domain-containing protein [Candidatus Woesearchaeota archaeon]